MNDRDREEARLQEVRRRARELRQQPAGDQEQTRAGKRRGPIVTSWRPAGHTGHPQKDYSGAMAHGGEPGRERRETWSPRTRVLDRDGKMIVRIELPGLDPKDVDVRVEDQILVVEGERQDDRPENSGQRSGWGYGPFRREIALPLAVDPSDLKACFRNGVLEVAVPQPPLEQRRKRIKVEAA